MRCAGVGLPLSFTSIPDVAENGNMLSFDTANMKRIFDEGVALAQGPGLWVTPVAEPPTLGQFIENMTRPRA